MKYKKLKSILTNSLQEMFTVFPLINSLEFCVYYNDDDNSWEISTEDYTFNSCSLNNFADHDLMSIAKGLDQLILKSKLRFSAIVSDLECLSKMVWKECNDSLGWVSKVPPKWVECARKGSQASRKEMNHLFDPHYTDYVAINVYRNGDVNIFENGFDPEV